MNTYPKTHAIITFGTHKSLECLLAVKPYNESYCKHFGIDYYHIDISINDLYPRYVNTLNRAPHTLKFSILLYFLDNVKKKYDYIWWCDSDILLFNNFSILSLLKEDANRLFPVYNIYTNHLNFRIHGGLFALETSIDNINLLQKGAFDMIYSPFYFRFIYDNFSNTLDECILGECSSIYKEGSQFIHVSNFMGQPDISINDVPLGAVMQDSHDKHYIFSLNEFPDYKSREVTCVHVFGENKIKNISKCIEVLDAARCFDYSTNL